MYLIDQISNQSATRMEAKLGESKREKSVRKGEESERLEEQSRKEEREENSHVDSAPLLLHFGNGLSPFGFRLFGHFILTFDTFRFQLAIYDTRQPL